MRLGVLAAALLCSRGAVAQQVLFSDDFETGTLLQTDTPPGKWQTMTSSPMPWETLAATAAAAYSGTHGFQLDDFEDGGTNVGNGRLIRYDLPQPVFGEVYARMRVRLGVDAGTGGPYPLQIHGNIFNGTIAEFAITGVGPNATLNCGNNTNFVFCPTKLPLTLDVWHEVYLSLEGLGTDAGVCSLIMDGKPVCSSPVDWTGVGVVAVLGGAGALDSSWDGTLSMDDVAVTAGAPAPGDLRLTGPGSGDGGSCAAFFVDAVNGIDGGQSAVLVPTNLALDAGGAPLFAGTSCSGIASSFTLQPDGGAVPFSVQLPLVSQVMTVSAQDLSGVLHPVARQLVVSGFVDAGTVDAGVDAGIDAGIDGGADAGIDGGADAGIDAGIASGGYDVGCGCSGGQGALLISLAVMTLTARRGRRRA